MTPESEIFCGCIRSQATAFTASSLISRDASHATVAATSSTATGGAVRSRRAGHRNLDQAQRPAAIARRLHQPRDEIAVNGGGVTAGTVLQQAEAVDHHINSVIAEQPRQRDRGHQQDRHLQVKRVRPLPGGELSRNPDHVKTSDAQIVGDEPSDQAEGAQHQDFAHRGKFAHHAKIPALRSSTTGWS